jgi:microcystin-dependent protein
VTIQNTDKLIVGRGNDSYQVSFQDSGLANTAYVDAIEARLSGGMAVPTGAIMFWGHAAPVPDGWMILDGRIFDVNNLTSLHDILSQTEGYTPGVLPDYRDRFVCGIGAQNNGIPGQALSELTKRPVINFTTNTATASHSHGFTMNHGHTLTVTGTTGTGGSHAHTYSAWSTTSRKGGGTGTSNPNSPSQNLTTATGGTHSHTVSVTGTVGTYTTPSDKRTSTGTAAHSHTVSGGGDATTRPLTIIGYWIIKT